MQDKNADNADTAALKFKAISEAYEVLSDEQMRRRYDRYGKEAVSGNAPASAGSRAHGADFAFHDPFDVFRSFFGGEDPFESFFSGAPHRTAGGHASGHGRRAERPGRGQRTHASPFDAMFGGMGFGGSMFGDLHDMMGASSGGGSSFVMSSSSSFGGGGGGRSESVSTSTVVRNG